ncbi:MAG TPA: hypothetical protein VFT80_10340 [Actinomycetota bacterium]|nr:hypothetical protein [Actinomycetota bacterium]
MSMSGREPSGWAIGWTYFAGFMMIMIGTFHVIAGLAGVLEDEFLRVVPAVGTEAQGDVYFLQFDATTWGWIHLIGGIVVALAGFGLFSGAVWARTIGVIMALISALIAFAWIPWYPVWGIIIIAMAIAVIWALTAHGRDVTTYE